MSAFRRLLPARGCRAAGFAAAILIAAAAVAQAASEFPFGQEILLDAKPMRGSKRVPSIEIDSRGQLVIDLWCDSVQGQVVVVEDTVSIMRGPITERQCTPERRERDADMLSSLLQATKWRRQGDLVIFEGAKQIRFRLGTN